MNDGYTYMRGGAGWILHGPEGKAVWEAVELKDLLTWACAHHIDRPAFTPVTPARYGPAPADAPAAPEYPKGWDHL